MRWQRRLLDYIWFGKPVPDSLKNFWYSEIRTRFFNRYREPHQLGLPFWCANYHDECEYVRDPRLTGFYIGRCWKCGDLYDPVNDR